MLNFHERSMPEFTLLTTDRGGQKSLIQVSADIKEPVTRQRELMSLLEAMKECNLKYATIVTLNQEEKLETESGRIQILPASFWALTFSKSSTCAVSF